MMIILQQLIALLPFLTLGLGILISMIFIARQRNHILIASISILSLKISLISLYFINRELENIKMANSTSLLILLHIDNYGIFYSALILITSMITCIFAYPWLKNFHDNKEEFYLLILIATLGGILLANTNHLTSLFLGIELISLPLSGLIGYTFQQKRSLEASIKYTILSATASSFLLLGIALLYAQSGHLSFEVFEKSFINDNIMLSKPLLLIGLGLMIVGFGFKLSLIPFHLWTPDVYQGTPAPVSVFLATASKISVFSVMMRLFFYTSINESRAIRITLGTIAFMSIIFGNLMAINQNDIKRLLGYSSISHFGYLIMALTAIKNWQILIETVGIYLIGYLFSSIGILGIVSLMSSPSCGQDANSLFFYRGLFWRRPVLAIMMTIMLLSLAGIPITLGFIGKFYVLAAGVQAKFWWLVAATLIGSAISFYYHLCVITHLYSSTPKRCNYDNNTLSNWHCSIGGMVITISTLLVLFFGIYPQPLINIIQYTVPLMQ